METFSALLAICVGNSPVPGEFPAQRPVTRSFDVFFALINGWVNNDEASDLRRHRAHYDVTVIIKIRKYSFQTTNLLNSPQVVGELIKPVPGNIYYCGDVIMSAMASQITSLTIVNSTVYSAVDLRKHQSSVSLAFVRGIYRWAVNSPHKGPGNAENASIWWRHHEND